jgi:hypothetical protein
MLSQRIAQLSAVLRVPLRPGRQMFTGREPVALLVVAPAVGQFEAVRQVHRVSSPSDKVIDVHRVPYARQHRRA